MQKEKDFTQIIECSLNKVWGRILQQYFNKVTKVRDGFSLKFFLHFVFTKQKLGIFSFILSYLKSKKYLKSKLEMI